MTEVFGDIALAIPLADEREVEELLGRIRSKQLLGRSAASRWPPWTAWLGTATIAGGVPPVPATTTTKRTTHGEDHST